MTDQHEDLKPPTLTTCKCGGNPVEVMPSEAEYCDGAIPHVHCDKCHRTTIPQTMYEHIYLWELMNTRAPDEENTRLREALEKQ